MSQRSLSPLAPHARTFARGGVFWRLERRGARLTVLRGKPGAKASVWLRECASDAAAEAWFEAALERKRGEGFRALPDPPGWPVGHKPARASSAAFEKALRAGAGDEVSCAYGVWLRERGDPRGHLVELQPPEPPASAHDVWVQWLLGRRTPAFAPAGTPALPRRWWWLFEDRGLVGRNAAAAAPPARGGRDDDEAAFLARHERRFYGTLTRADEEHASAVWRRGFLDQLSFTVPEDVPVDGDVPSVGSLLACLPRLASAKLLRVLEVVLPETFANEPAPPTDKLLRGLFRGGRLRALRSFSLSAFAGRPPGAGVLFADFDPEYQSLEDLREAPRLGDLRGLARALPGLEHLVLCGRGAEVDPSFTRLRHAELFFVRPEESAFAALAAARWPRLVSLRLGFGFCDDPRDEVAVLKALAPVLTGDGFPALRYLALEHVPLADEVCGVLVRAPLATRLAALELSDGSLTDEGARSLIRAHRRFTALHALHVGNNALTPASVRGLERAFPRLHAGSQIEQPWQGWNDQDWHVRLRRGDW